VGETPGTGEAPAAVPAAATGVPEQSAAAPRATARTAPEPATTAPEPEPATAPDREDSLNLLNLVGPVIVKRLAPVVGAAVAAGLIAWGIRRIVRRRRQA
jgi:predicted flap endonuclease-1-like 5' DNA nuclease